MPGQRDLMQEPSRRLVEGAAHVPERRAVVAALATAGIVGPILFTVVVVIQGLLRPGYSPVADPISALATGPNGWVQNLNFIVLGLLMLAYAVGLDLGMRPARAGMVGPTFLALAGMGAVLSGVVPLRAVAGGLTYEPVGHTVAVFMSFLGAGVGLILISRRMTGDPRWRSLGTYVLATGSAIIVLFLAIGALASTPDAPLNRWFGLTQRLLLVVWFPCVIVLALRLLRITRGGEALR
jgi:hypothetical membrane protein